MKSNHTPMMTDLQLGGTFRVLQVSGSTGMYMPEHFSTKEAVVIIQKGAAILKMKGVDHYLEINNSLIVPAGVKHELQLTDDFLGLVIMEADSEIKFITI